MAENQTDKSKCSSKERLIQAAKQFAQGRSFDEITIEEIIKTADLSRPAFYYHFAGGKEELRTEMVQRGLLDDKPNPDTRLAILEAAVRIFAQSGVSAATLDDIAAAAGVSRGALVWHFRTKDDLLAAILRHYGPHSIICPVVDQIEQDMLNGVELDDRTIFRRLAGGFYDAFTAQGDLTRLAILVVYTHPEAAHLLSDMVLKGRKRIIEYVRKRQEEGHFRKDIDAGLFVQVIAAVFAMRAVSRGLKDLLPFTHLSREEVIDQLVSLVLYGIVQCNQLPQSETSVVS